MSDFDAKDAVNRPSVEEQKSRRTFLQMSVGGAVAGMIGATAVEVVAPRRAAAQSTLTPDAALKELMDGNARFAANKMTSFEHDLDVLKSKTVDKQEPFAAVLSCADSRVPVEILFDQSIGHVFVTRVAGNVVTPEIIGSLEYGAAVLGTKVIVVLGHRGCGAVKAAIAGKGVPGQISSLFPHIQAAVEAAGPDTEATTKENAKHQAKLLRESSTVISEMAKDGKIKVVGAYYDLGSGAVTLLE
jgi:carbonic anhydrase